ncbi:MAG: hypothetical protein AB1714_29465 [Acidobacteriota bacterium]
MRDWPREIADAETIVRGICSPYHVSKSGTLKPTAFDPAPNTDEVSVLRHDWIGTEECRRRSRALENAEQKKVYRGMAALSARQIRDSGAEVVDSREEFEGHTDIKHGFVVRPGEPLPPAALLAMRERNRALARIAMYYPDPDPAGAVWTGPPLRPRDDKHGSPG